MTTKVGTIQNYDVMYVSERDLVFCKNTVVPLRKIKEAIKSPLDRTLIEEKDLSVTKTGASIDFGCLHTTIENVKLIEKEINKIKYKK